MTKSAAPDHQTVMGREAAVKGWNEGKFVLPSAKAGAAHPMVSMATKDYLRVS